jgi:hypothetical protein
LGACPISKETLAPGVVARRNVHPGVEVESFVLVDAVRVPWHLAGMRQALGGAFALRPYVLAAAALHAALLAIEWFQFHPTRLRTEIRSTHSSLVNVDIEPAPVPEREGRVPGGGPPIVRGSKEVPALRPPQLAPAKTKPATLDPVRSADLPDDGTSPVFSLDAIAVEAAIERRSHGQAAR